MVRCALLLMVPMLAVAPLAAQTAPVAMPGSRITNAGVERAAATVDSVFIEKQRPRGNVDVSRAKAAFGFEAEVSFDEGLRETVEWYDTSNAVV